MAELTTQERLQPSLLDRLTDASPEKKMESREERVLSLSRLRESVLRDLTWLLNSVHLEAVQDLEGYVAAQHSVINFGIPDFSGTSVAGANLGKLQSVIRQAVVDFEPRISADSVNIRVHADADAMNRRALCFVIEGSMWAQPMPVSLYLKTEIDLETSTVTVVEGGR